MYNANNFISSGGHFALSRLLLPEMTSKISKTALFNFIKKDTFILLHLFFKIVCKINLLEMASVHIQAPLHSTFSKTSSNSTIML